MLKKLVKYGNSNALVLDKALLELLNIGEGSIVKIKTDGTSLIITPQSSNGAQATITPTIIPQETLNQAAMQNVAQYYDNPEEYMSELKKLTDRYAHVMRYFESQEYRQAVLALDEKFNGNGFDPLYAKEIKALNKKYESELVQMDKEIQILSKKYASKETAKSQPDSSFVAQVEKFKSIHEKYRHVQEQIFKLNENPEYINESVILAEKYQMTKNSREYINEHNQLIAKYIPEWQCYQDELKAVGESIK